ncbi:respiratory-chain NADH dehydrogenase, 49 Kd subunit [Mycobacterium xenopi 3993]|nr:respiratory-chain NADH dehydrogenase, 49 Kd subunit [Mycobacterium xenopi 3993]
MPRRLRDLEDLLNENYIWKARTQGIGYLDLTGCMALGITGPILRSTGCPTTCGVPTRIAGTKTTNST